MPKFQPELETCPICGSTGNCHIHDYYGRSIIDFRDGKRQKSDLCVMRVFCDSCEHAHAILPDIIIPYSSYCSRRSTTDGFAEQNGRDADQSGLIL